MKEKLKSLRAQKSWTQQDLADKCGVSIKTVQNWEQGRTKISGSALVILNGLIDGTDRKAVAKQGPGKND